MKKLLISSLIILFPLFVQGQINVNQGGTGKVSFPANSLISVDGSGFQRFQATSSPTVNSILATSTTGTSTFQGVVSIDAGASAPCNNAWFQVGSSSARLFVDKQSGNVGIGTCAPNAVNANSRLTVVGAGALSLVSSTTDDTTATAAIGADSYAPGSRAFLGAHGQSQVSTQYGIAVGGYAELAGIANNFGTFNGLLIGTRTANTPIIFGNNSLERLRITGAGLIGIGTTTPGARLDVTSTGLVGVATGIRLLNPDTGTGSGSAIDFYSGNGNRNARIYNNPTNTNTGDLRFATANGGSFADAMTILNSGNVGIGNTAPGQLFQVGASGSNVQIWGDGGGTNVNSNGKTLRIGTLDAFDVNFVTNTTNVMTLKSGGGVGVGTTSPASYNTASVAGLLDITGTSNPSLVIHGTGGTGPQEIMLTDNNSAGAYLKVVGATTGINNFLAFKTASANSSYTDNVEAMRITSSGNVGIGTTTPSAIIDGYTTASSTTMLLEAAVGKGGCLIMKDVASATYTQLYSQGGVLYSKVATSLTTCN